MASSQTGEWEPQVSRGGGDGGRDPKYHREASLPSLRVKERGGGGALPLPAQAAGALPTPRSRAFRGGGAERTSTVCRLRPPARPGSCPSLSSLHPLPARTREPPPRSTRGGSGCGVVPWKKLRTAAQSSGTKLQGDGSQGGALAQESLEPPSASAELTPHPQPRSGLARGAGLFPRLHRAAQEEQRGRSATRGGSCNSRGPCASLRGAPGAACAPAPELCPQQARSRSGERLVGSEGSRRELGPRSRDPLALSPPGAWLPGPVQLSEGSARHPLQPAPRGLGGEGVPWSASAAHPQRRFLRARRG